VLTHEASDADRATQALALIWDWACAHADHFFDPEDRGHDRNKPPSTTGWAGHWTGSRTMPGAWQFLGFIPERLCAILKAAGHDPDAILSSWKDRGWLYIDHSDKAGKYHQVAIAGHKPRVVAIKRDAMGEAGCCPANPLPQEYLIHVTRCFLNATRDRGQPPGDATKLNTAVQAVIEWLSTVRPGDRGGGEAAKRGENESLAGESKEGSLAG
jgi:hypothetical protein